MRRGCARSRMSSLVTVALITAWCFAASPIHAAPNSTESLGSLINKERQAHSLQPLALDESLCKVARDHATDMIETGYFGHVSPTGSTLSTRLSRANIPFRKAGENLAGHTSVAKAHAMLMMSAMHRGNILNPEFHEMGIAVVSGGPYGLMIVTVFLADTEVDQNAGAVLGGP